ncbi:centrosomal protein of 164 kDa-like [Boleophthalmus pectinirostris]|uniref:centrosomal protein of 164 kDa-like n=1 Tax=Boleophthalmus pectinirostris TaxID=150288 RepID=UPI00242FBD95|nr:centrosomal protein of 164 kDa-like [Boleophthalmus pectinirostris]
MKWQNPVVEGITVCKGPGSASAAEQRLQGTDVEESGTFMTEEVRGRYLTLQVEACQEVRLITWRLHPENQGVPGEREQETGGARGGVKSSSDKPKKPKLWVICNRQFQKGISLLQRKEEEKLQHLESSLTDKPLFENTSGIPERTVTSDVSESDVSSTVDPPFTRDQAAVPHRVQDLVESLQVTSGQVNTVVGEPLPGLDFSTAHMRRSQTSENWAPPPPVFSSTVNTGLKTSEDLISSRWRQIFPGAAMGPSVSKRSTSYSSHTPLSQSNWSAPYRQSTTEADGHRLQDLIDSNKKWLESRRKDTNIPLLTRYRPATNGGLIQLGLDDNNEIRVFHY